MCIASAPTMTSMRNVLLRFGAAVMIACATCSDDVIPAQACKQLWAWAPITEALVDHQLIVLLRDAVGDYDS